jgi:hypothetical protein
MILAISACLTLQVNALPPPYAVKLEGYTTVIRGGTENYRVSFWIGNQEVPPPAQTQFRWQSMDAPYFTSPSRYIIIPSELGKFTLTVFCTLFNGSTSEVLTATLELDIIKSPVPPPSINSSGGELLPAGASFELSTGEYHSYKWYRGSEVISENRTVTVSQPDLYWVQVKYDRFIFDSSPYTIRAAPDVSGNYIISNSVQSPMTSLSAANGLSASQNQRQVEYFDGLGRPLQSISVQGSPNGRDLIQPVQYDSFGRASVKYLPYVAKNAGGFYRTNAIGTGTSGTGPYIGSEQQTYYTQNDNTISNTTRPYARNVFEKSPLERVVDTGAPGEAWQPGSGGSVRTAYETNGDNEVIAFKQDLSTGNLQWLINNQLSYYPNSHLHALRTTDEHGFEEIIYTDKSGKTILKRTQYDGSGSTKQYADTYYVYDLFDNLVYVVPPEAVRHLLNPTTH